jgi:hypothetical protein
MERLLAARRAQSGGSLPPPVVVEPVVVEPVVEPQPRSFLRTLFQIFVMESRR